MKSFMQVVKEDAEYMKPVDEGWGKFLLTSGIAYAVGAAMGPIGGVVMGTVMGTSAGLTANSMHALVSLGNLRKMFNNNKLRTYMRTEVKNIINKEKKHNKNLTETIPTKMRSGALQGTEALKYHQYWINPYTVVLYDLNHIEAVKAVLMDKDSLKLSYYNIPVPDNKEWGFYKD